MAISGIGKRDFLQFVGSKPLYHFFIGKAFHIHIVVLAGAKEKGGTLRSHLRLLAFDGEFDGLITSVVSALFLPFHDVPTHMGVKGFVGDEGI